MSLASAFRDDLPGDHPRHATHPMPVAGHTSSPAEPNEAAFTQVVHGRLADALLLIYADTLDDLEKIRTATANRVRALSTEHMEGPDGGSFGKSLGGTPEAERMQGLVDGLAALEHGAELELKRSLRKHPLGPWVKSMTGVGEKQGARLLASIGDPYLRADGTPRTVSQLWAYCGYHVLSLGQRTTGDHCGDAEADPLHPGQPNGDTQRITAGVDPSASDQAPCGIQTTIVAGGNSSDPGPTCREAQSERAGVAPSRKRGQKANWNATAKMRGFLIAEAAVKAGVRKLPDADDTNGYDVENRKPISSLGEVYLNGRAKYADATHPAACARCGPSGKPALPGSPLSEGHKHARALRLVAKQVLKDLWLESKRLHEALT